VPENAYTTFHSQRVGAHLYPTEFVVRTMLGTYPGLKLERKYKNARLLDLGFGDGRNFPLFANLEVRIYGAEPDRELCSLVSERMRPLGIQCELRPGSNAHVPFEDGFFDYVVACHSIYYVDSGDTFSQNVAEAARVLKPGGWIIASVPDRENFILAGADALPDGHWRIRSDPYGLRNGSIFRAFADRQEVAAAFTDCFEELSIASFRDDWYGILVSGFVVVARRSETA
jgi:SAM-dependent methyltransferase